MGIKSAAYLRGRRIELVDNVFVYCDTGLPTAETHKERPCGNCGKYSIKDGHEEYDACLGKLPDLMNACCGHGTDNEAYVQYWDGKVISGVDAIMTINELKKEKTMAKHWGSITGHRSKKLGRKCPQCKRLWITRDTDRHRPYCSEKCANKSKEQVKLVSDETIKEIQYQDKIISKIDDTLKSQI